MEVKSNPFRKAGIVLLIIGLLDILFMVYCIINSISYSSSFNIFAVIAGIFLLKGSTKTARIIRWFTGFFIVGFLGALVIFPAIMPVKLLLVEAKLAPLATMIWLLFSVTFIAILFWVHLQFFTQESMALFQSSGYKTDKPTSAYLSGAFLVLLIAGLFFSILNGEPAQKAESLAREQLGPNFEYHVSNISYSGSSGSATVTAYNDREVQNIAVSW